MHTHRSSDIFCVLLLKHSTSKALKYVQYVLQNTILSDSQISHSTSMSHFSNLRNVLPHPLKTQAQPAVPLDLWTTYIRIC